MFLVLVALSCLAVGFMAGECATLSSSSSSVICMRASTGKMYSEGSMGTGEATVFQSLQKAGRAHVCMCEGAVRSLISYLSVRHIV